MIRPENCSVAAWARHRRLSSIGSSSQLTRTLYLILRLHKNLSLHTALGISYTGKTNWNLQVQWGYMRGEWEGEGRGEGAPPVGRWLVVMVSLLWLKWPNSPCLPASWQRNSGGNDTLLTDCMWLYQWLSEMAWLILNLLSKLDCDTRPVQMFCLLHGFYQMALSLSYSRTVWCQ